MWRDKFTVKAKRQGYQARSVFKLEELDKKYKIFIRGDVVLDLGCFPGSWMQYAKEKVVTGVVIGVDLKRLPKLKEEIVFIQKDVFDFGKDDVADYKVTVVLSDMAPATTGIRDIDQGASIDLSLRAFEIAVELDAEVFVCKYFQGPEIDDFLKDIRKHYAVVKTYKPKTSRNKSIEMYVVAKKFK